MSKMVRFCNDALRRLEKLFSGIVAGSRDWGWMVIHQARTA